MQVGHRVFSHVTKGMSPGDWQGWKAGPLADLCAGVAVWAVFWGLAVHGYAESEKHGGAARRAYIERGGGAMDEGCPQEDLVAARRASVAATRDSLEELQEGLGELLLDCMRQQEVAPTMPCTEALWVVVHKCAPYATRPTPRPAHATSRQCPPCRYLWDMNESVLTHPAA